MAQCMCTCQKSRHALQPSQPGVLLPQWGSLATSACSLSSTPLNDRYAGADIRLDTQVSARDFPAVLRAPAHMIDGVSARASPLVDGGLPCPQPPLLGGEEGDEQQPPTDVAARVYTQWLHTTLNQMLPCQIRLLCITGCVSIAPPRAMKRKVMDDSDDAGGGGNSGAVALALAPPTAPPPTGPWASTLLLAQSAANIPVQAAAPPPSARSTGKIYRYYALCGLPDAQVTPAVLQLLRTYSTSLVPGAAATLQQEVRTSHGHGQSCYPCLLRSFRLVSRTVLLQRSALTAVC
jgi:hypothetical protein